MDNKRIIIDDNNYLEYNLTPWNDRSLHIKTNEIYSIIYENNKNLNLMIKSFIDISSDNNINHSSIRINTNDINIKKYLEVNKFYFVETSLVYKLKNFKKIDFNSIIKTKVILEEPTKNDFNCIANIAKESILFGKFHEDYNIELSMAKDRFYNWIIDMEQQGKKFLISRNKGNVKAFIAYEIKDNNIVLLLGGSKEISSTFTFYFWSSFMEYFKKYEATSITALVSVNNIGIMNLYSKFGFKIDKTFFGLHKIYK